VIINVMWLKLVTGTPVPRPQRIEKIFLPESILYVRPEPMIRQTCLLVLSVLALQPVNGIFSCACGAKETFTKLVPKRAGKNFPFLRHRLTVLDEALPLNIMYGE
jgi:hypothetical protein